MIAMLKVVASGATAVASLGVVRSGRECGRDGIGLEQLRHRALPSFPSLGLSSLEFNPLMTRTGIQRRIRIQRSIGPPSVLQIDEHQHGESPAPIEEHLLETEQSADVADKVESSFPDTPAVSKMQQRLTKRQTERKAYLLAAIASTTGFTTLAVAAVFYRFIWQMQVLVNASLLSTPSYTYCRADSSRGYSTALDDFLQSSPDSGLEPLSFV